jgi:uncharacterized membrane protein SirB2
MYAIVKFIHVSCVILSLSGFAVRGFLKVVYDRVPSRFAYRVLPHLIDTLLLGSAVVLAVLARQYPFVSPWVTAKVVALLVYIGLGILLMRLSLDPRRRALLYGLALLSGVYIVLVALSKNPFPWFV